MKTERIYFRRSKRKSEKYIIEAERFIADENNRTSSTFDASRFSSRFVILLKYLDVVK